MNGRRRSRAQLVELAWQLAREAIASRKRGRWQRRLASLARWRAVQLQLTAADRRILRVELQAVLEHIFTAKHRL